MDAAELVKADAAVHLRADFLERVWKLRSLFFGAKNRPRDFVPDTSIL
jgi:hypothetical protein